MQLLRSELEQISGLLITFVEGRTAIKSWLIALEQLAEFHEQAGAMHGIDILLGSRFAQRKKPVLLCFYRRAANASASELVGAVLLWQYQVLGCRIGVFATGDPFGIRAVVGPPHLQEALCATAGTLLLRSGAWLVLTTRRILGGGHASVETSPALGDCWYALQRRTVQDTLELRTSAEETIQHLGRRTRVHLRADRRHFNRMYPQAQLLDATAALAAASDDELAALNLDALDTIPQTEFNHQVRTVCRGAGGFVLGLQLDGHWISLIGGWRQRTDTFVEWQCNRRGFQKISIGGVMRTYLLMEEARLGTVRLHFHGGTSHSMGHSFQHSGVEDLLMRRIGLLSGCLVKAANLLCRWYPTVLQRGNFVLNALCAPGLTWQRHSTRPQPARAPDSRLW